MNEKYNDLLAKLVNEEREAGLKLREAFNEYWGTLAAIDGAKTAIQYMIDQETKAEEAAAPKEKKK